MQDNTTRKTLAIVGMAENFGKEISPELLRIWLRLLEPYAACDVEFAAMQVIERYEYKTLPPFAVIKKFLDRATGKITPEQALKMAAQAEWGKLLEALSERGLYQGPPPDMHPTTAYVLRCMGGWALACQWSESKLEWREKEFLEKWLLSNGNEEVMALGAKHVAALAEGPQALGDILRGLPLDSGQVLPQ